MIGWVIIIWAELSQGYDRIKDFNCHCLGIKYETCSKVTKNKATSRVFNDNQYEIVFYLIIMFYWLITFHVVDYTRFSCFVFVKYTAFLIMKKKRKEKMNI